MTTPNRYADETDVVRLQSVVDGWDPVLKIIPGISRQDDAFWRLRDILLEGK